MGDGTIRIREKGQLYPGPRAFNPIATILYHSKSNKDHYVLEVSMHVYGEVTYHKYYFGDRHGGRLTFQEMQQSGATPAQELDTWSALAATAMRKCYAVLEQEPEDPAQDPCVRFKEAHRLPLTAHVPGAAPLTLSLVDHGILTFSGNNGALAMRDATGTEEGLIVEDTRTTRTELNAPTTQYESVTDITPQYAYEVNGILLLIAATPEAYQPYIALVKTPTGTGRVELSRYDKDFRVWMGKHGEFRFSSPEAMRYHPVTLQWEIEVIGQGAGRKILEQQQLVAGNPVTVTTQPVKTTDLAAFAGKPLGAPMEFMDTGKLPWRHWRIADYAKKHPERTKEMEQILEWDEEWQKTHQ